MRQRDEMEEERRRVASQRRMAKVSRQYERRQRLRERFPRAFPAAEATGRRLSRAFYVGVSVVAVAALIGAFFFLTVPVARFDGKTKCEQAYNYRQSQLLKHGHLTVIDNARIWIAKNGCEYDENPE